MILLSSAKLRHALCKASASWKPTSNLSAETDMSNSTQQRSLFVRWLDAFLQEENIKWVLGLGVCILLASSLRLVTLHWVEYTPVWKYLILLGYTASVFGLSELSYHRLGLRKTGTVL